MNILIVEDEPAIADTIEYSLRTEGMQTHHVASGQSALDYFAQHKPDLIVLDIGLPDISGFDVCRKIRECSEVPIIFLTARVDDIDQVLGLELGADDYIVKPFSPRVLSARVRNRLRKQSGSSQQRGFFIDEDGFRVLLEGRNLNLSRYEFRILCALLKAPGRVYSRTQLMDIAWDEPERSFDRTVDTHIKTIRQKIQSISPELSPIKTHRGLGYSYQG